MPSGNATDYRQLTAKLEKTNACFLLWLSAQDNYTGEKVGNVHGVSTWSHWVSTVSRLVAARWCRNASWAEESMSWKASRVGPGRGPLLLLANLPTLPAAQLSYSTSGQV